MENKEKEYMNNTEKDVHEYGSHSHSSHHSHHSHHHSSHKKGVDRKKKNRKEKIERFIRYNKKYLIYCATAIAVFICMNGIGITPPYGPRSGRFPSTLPPRP